MDIIHALDIQTTAEKLFEALSTDRGTAAWWTKAKTQATVGGINEFAFGAGAVGDELSRCVHQLRLGAVSSQP